MAQETKIISPIAIDMGAKNTGVYLNHFTQGEDPTTSGNIAGKTIVIDSSSITWSQVNRTLKRHQVRNNKRRKLAKRLFKLILSEYDVKPNLKQVEYLNGLLNRRGYTYLVEDLDESLVDQSFIAEYFVEKHADFFKSKDSFYNDFLTISNDIERCKSLEKTLTLSKNDAKQAVNENKQEFADAYANIKTTLKTQINAEDGGHKYRAKYLENIEADIKSSKLLEPLLGNDLTDEKLACLIGNISNLQLRILRKYFNDKAMRSGDQWKPEELHKLFFKWVRSWHAKQNDEKENRKALLELKEKDILAVFTTFDPKLSIPPYEDQNNRRPPKDLTLRLKPEGLDHSSLTNWEAITQLLSDKYIVPQTDPHVTEKIKIAEGLKDNVRIQKNSGETEERQMLADTLHRILDRTTARDPYKLRWLAQGRETPEVNKATELLNNHSNNQADNIIVFAKNYYAEVDIAKQGLWTEDNSLFFRCETNPPHKNKIQHHLISHILGERLNNQELSDFIKNCWNSDDVKIGRSKIVGIAKSSEEERKIYGNKFKHILQKQIWLDTQENRQLDNEKDHGVDGKSILKAHQNCQKAAEKVAEYFKHNDKQKKIYSNVFSFCQLYNILETQIKGFSKTDKWNTVENSWRSRKDNFDEKGEPVANASRLTADSIRPFDGMLDRIISRQAYEIARMKIKQIEGLNEKLNIDENDTLFVPILMEQNRFSFEQSLHEIKGDKNVKKKARDRVKKGLKNQEKQWQDKNNRIKKNQYCPYTGDNIIRGEIDHIIPQSKSKHHSDVVFNSEANLIYCSNRGNNEKGNNRYSFNELQSNYLDEIFGLSSKEQIKQEIIDFVNSLGNSDEISFHNLEEKEQNYLRHALFISKLDAITFPLLNTRYKTLVNGTQGYLGKQIRKLLQEKYPKVEVKTYQINAQEVSQLRTILGEYDEDLKKQERQDASGEYDEDLKKQERQDASGEYDEDLKKQERQDASGEYDEDLKKQERQDASGEYDEDLKKPERQGAFSHVIDAALVLAVALKSEAIAEALKTIHLTEESEKGEWLKKLLPKNGNVQHIKRKPKYCKKLQSTQIFKEGLYGERFMPILLDNDKIYYGFSLDNCCEKHPLKEPKKGINNFDKKLQTNKEEQQKKQNEYFELLKPFLYTGSTKKKNKKPVTGSLSDNQQKYTYLSIDKTKALTHLQKCAKEVCGDAEIEQAKQLEQLRYSVEKKEIKSVLLTGQGKKTFIKKEGLDKKLKVSGFWLPAKSQWEQLIRHPIKDYDGNETTLEECFGESKQVEVDNPELIDFWEILSKQSGLEISCLKDNLLNKNKKGELTKKAVILPKKFLIINLKNMTA